MFEEKKMRKYFYFFLAMAMLFTTACAYEEEEPVRYVFSGSDDSKVDEEIMQQVLAHQMGYRVGEVTDEGWESTWMQMRYTIPEGAISYTREEMDKEILSLYEEYDLGYEAQQAILEETRYEMFVETPEKDFQLFVYVELSDPSTTMDEYINALELQWSQSDIWEVTTISRDETEKIAEKEFRHVVFQCEHEGIVLYEEMWLRRIGDRMIRIDASYINPEVREQYMSGFAPN